MGLVVSTTWSAVKCSVFLHLIPVDHNISFVKEKHQIWQLGGAPSSDSLTRFSLPFSFRCNIIVNTLNLKIMEI